MNPITDSISLEYENGGRGVKDREGGRGKEEEEGEMEKVEKVVCFFYDSFLFSKVTVDDARRGQTSWEK